MVTKNLITIGISLVFIGIILLFIGSFLATKENSKTSIKSGGIVFIGPFPLIGFASDKKMFYALLIFSSLIFIIWFLIRKFGGR